MSAVRSTFGRNLLRTMILKKLIKPLRKHLHRIKVIKACLQLEMMMTIGATHLLHRVNQASSREMLWRICIRQ